MFSSFVVPALRQRRGMPLAERFAVWVMPEPNSGCWLWIGTYGERGYGTFKNPGGSSVAHRASYELFKGPIPTDLLVRHKCDVRACVNPDHLELGTHKDNAMDREIRKRRYIQRGEESGASIMNEGDVHEIRDLARQGYRHKDIATTMGLSRQQIGRIIAGECWSHVPGGIKRGQLRSRGSQLGHAKLTEADIPVIRRLLSEGVYTTVIARMFGVSAFPIHAIKKGALWRHVPGHKDLSHVKVNRKLNRDFCSHGHSLVGDNLRLKKDGGRVCRACMRGAWRRHREKKKAAA